LGPASGPLRAPNGPSAWTARLGTFELDGARIAWRDEALAPAVEWQVEPLALRVQGLQWPVQADAALTAALRLVAGGKVMGQAQLEGPLSDRQARLAWRLDELDLALAAPYLRPLLRPTVQGKVHGQGQVDWAAGDAPRLQLQATQLRVDALRVDEPDAARRAPPALQFARLELTGASADVRQQRVVIDALQLQRPSVELRRDRDGVLNVQRWPAAAASAPPSDASPEPVAGPGAGQAVGDRATGAVAAPPAWQLELRQFRLDDGRVRLVDAALPASPLQLSGLRARAGGLRWPLAAEPLPVQLAAQFGAAGVDAEARLDWNGRVAAAPLQARGRLLLERMPVHVFEPYFADRLPVTLRRLEAGFRGDVDLRRVDGDWAARLAGDALLADLRVGLGTADSEDAVRWNALAANGLDLQITPGTKPLLQVAALRLEDYASRVVITEDGQLNLQAAAAPKARAAPAAAGSAPAAAAAPAAASAPAGGTVSAPVAALSGLPIDFVVGATQIVNASVDFNDRFVRPNYRAQLTELNGSLGRLDSRSRDAATVQLEGRVAGTGLLQIEGALNPAVRPPALDLKAKAHDIELPGLTPYSAKYAGYPIERGKLSVDVAYKIDADGKLDASNRIVVDQLTFGPKTDSPQATKLPVKLAVALLQDANGVIDLDLPITGSLDDPQFSVGALIWKVIVNLLNKALTSPFSLLGGSGGKDLSVVAFEPGSARLAAGAPAQLDAVAKAMADRPALRLTITGEADLAREQDAMRRAAFEQRLRDEQRRDRARGSLGGGAAAGDAPLPPLTADERARLIARVYADTKLPDKPRNFIGLTKDIPTAEMETMLVAAMPADDAAARALAQLRGRSVRDALLAKGLPGQRLFLAEAKDPPAAADNGAWSPRARLALGIE
jgi:hypothetical protein